MAVGTGRSSPTRELSELGESVESRLRLPKMSMIRSSPAAISSNDLVQVGERLGSERKSSRGSRSSEGGDVGELKVSPFLRRMAGEPDGDGFWGFGD